jgi:hypothetical protein
MKNVELYHSQKENYYKLFVTDGIHDEIVSRYAQNKNRQK